MIKKLLRIILEKRLKTLREKRGLVRSRLVYASGGLVEYGESSESSLRLFSQLTRQLEEIEQHYQATKRTLAVLGYPITEPTPYSK